MKKIFVFLMVLLPFVCLSQASFDRPGIATSPMVVKNQFELGYNSGNQCNLVYRIGANFFELRQTLSSDFKDNINYDLAAKIHAFSLTPFKTKIVMDFGVLLHTNSVMLLGQARYKFLSITYNQEFNDRYNLMILSPSINIWKFQISSDLITKKNLTIVADLNISFSIGKKAQIDYSYNFEEKVYEIGIGYAFK